MTLKTTLSLAIALPVALGVSATAYADRDEPQLSLVTGGSLAKVAAFDGEGATELFGGGITLARGIRNWLTLGVSARYDARSDVEIPAASLDGLGGNGHTLFTDLQVATAAAEVRLYAEFSPFLRSRPFIGVGGGLQAIQYGSPALFLDSGAAAAVGESSMTFSPLATGEAGMAYRLHDSFEAAVVLNIASTSELTRYGLNIEFSWMLR